MAGNDRCAAGSRGPSPETLARAVAFCHDDGLTDERIARELGVTRRTLARWKRHPLWASMTLAVVAAFRLQLDKGWFARHGIPWPPSRLDEEPTDAELDAYPVVQRRAARRLR